MENFFQSKANERILKDGKFCGVFYETGYLRAVYDRIRNCFSFSYGSRFDCRYDGAGNGDDNFGSVRLKDMAGRAVAEYAAGVGTTRFFYDFGNRDSDFRQMFQLIFSLCLRLYRSARKI